ncbi:dipeptidase [Candidatus Avoscillospira sp. LCP25S3_F1]|uniref:dipeptidase n=1 Tax=Candidatus Avoscillospira sp. LCP25S3_F1 TaxID=3438825 RepID=UPI003F910415
MKVAVSHDDFPAVLALCRAAGTNGYLRSYYLPRFRHAGVELVIGAVFVHPSTPPGAALENALEQLAAVEAEVAASGGAFALVTTAAELEDARRRGQIALVLSLEGADPLGGTSVLLPILHRLGVRLLGLTWNGRNAFADGCDFSGGLTAAGRDLIYRVWDLGLAVDVSHLSDTGLQEVLSLGRGPVLASHSNCRTLCPHRRNLTDSQLTALGRRDGVVGLNQVSFLVRRQHTRDGLDDLCAHLLHIWDRTGGRACLGLDFAREYGEAVSRRRTYWLHWDPSQEDLLDGWGGLAALEDRLRERGFPPEALEAVFYTNLWNFLHRILPGGPVPSN